ncbi:MAG TPA: biopolymer transporter ExbD [Candidatus Eremiobacteraceae bacterium]
MAEINITPFTDVLLVLLIIFMILAALTTPPGFQKELPGPCACGGHPSMHDIEVTVAASGAITIDGQSTTSSNVYDRMAEAVRSHGGRTGFSKHVALTADSASPYGSIIKVLDAAREAGDDDVGFVIE